MAPETPAALSEPRLQQIAAQLREVRIALREPGPGQRRRWLQGPQHTDLILDYEGEKLLRMEFSFAGYWVLVEDGQTFTGHTDEFDPHSGGSLVSRLVERDDRNQLFVIEAARVLLRSMSDQVLAAQLLPLLPS
jgi:hypothetical protein